MKKFSCHENVKMQHIIFEKCKTLAGPNTFRLIHAAEISQGETRMRVDD